MKGKLKQGTRRWITFLSLAAMISMMFSMTACAKEQKNAFVSRYITVKEQKMHVVLYGDVNEKSQEFQNQDRTTLVMLPALGVPSPYIYFKPLAEELGESFNVVIVEPFGYGLSDVTTVERTVENINQELNEALTVLEIDKCVLLVHSISGVYGLNFVLDYPEKVEGFIAVDNTVYDEELKEALEIEQTYMQQGIKEFDATRKTFASIEEFKKALAEQPEEYGAGLPEITGYTYSESDKEAYLQAYSLAFNETISDEVAHMNTSVASIIGKKFPDNLPVLTMVSGDNAAAIPAWETAHRAQLNLEAGKHEIYIVEGSHYIWYTNLSAVTEHINAWKDKNQF